MPNRWLRDSILTSEKVASLPDFNAETFYRKLMSVVDDFGLYHANPKILRANLFPLQLDRVREADISRWIAACENSGLIRLYEAEGKQYLEYLNLGEPRARKSKFPKPPPNGTHASARTCKHMQTYALGSEYESDSGTGGGIDAQAREAEPPIQIPTFEPIPKGKFAKELNEMIAAAKAEIKKIKENPKHWKYRLRRDVADLVQMLESEATEATLKRVEGLKKNQDSYERLALTDLALAAVGAWLGRINEIEDAKNGVKR